MSTELRPVAAKPARGPWPIAILSGVLAAVILWGGQRALSAAVSSSPSASPSAQTPPMRTSAEPTRLAAAPMSDPAVATPAAAIAIAPATSASPAPMPMLDAAKVEPVVLSSPAPVAPAVAAPALAAIPAAKPNVDWTKPGVMPAKMAAAVATSPATAPATAPAPAMADNESDAVSVPMVARADLDRETARFHAAQKEVASYRAQLDTAQKQLADARAQLAALHPPQPVASTDRDQILQTLAPVLKSGTGQP